MYVVFINYTLALIYLRSIDLFTYNWFIYAVLILFLALFIHLRSIYSFTEYLFVYVP
jgi:hypothetical protein